MWTTLGRYALKLALWCLANPETVVDDVKKIHSIIEELRPR